MRPIVLAAMLLMFYSAPRADEYDDIVNGCNFANAEFGTVAIQICIKDNQAARAEVLQYPKEVKEIVARCARGSEMGWSMVKLCVDKDIEAEAALANHGKEHDLSMEVCKEEFGRRGAARIKKCVDQAIEAGRPETEKRANQWNGRMTARSPVGFCAPDVQGACRRNP